MCLVSVYQIASEFKGLYDWVMVPHHTFGQVRCPSNVVYFRLEARCSQPDWREALDTVEHQDDPAVFSRLLTNCGQAPQKTFWGRSCTFIADYPLSDIFGYKKLTFSLRSADHPSFDLELFGPLDEPAFLQKMEAGAKLIREKQYTIGITKLMEPARLPDWVISQSQPRSAVWLF